MTWLHRNFWPLFLVGIGVFFIGLLGWSLYQSVIYGSAPVDRSKPAGLQQPTHG